MDAPLQDSIRVKDRLLNISLASGSRWPSKGQQGTLQPITLSVEISYDVAPCSTTDSLDLSINYSSISKKLGSALAEPDNLTYRSIEDVLSRALTVVQGALTDIAATDFTIKIIQLKAPLHCKNVGLEALSVREREGWTVSKIRHFVTDFTCPTIVGVNDVERVEEQDVVVNISIETRRVPLDQINLDFRCLSRSLWNGIRQSSYLTLESLANYTAQQALACLSQDFGSDVRPSVTIAAAKPCALVYAAASEVQVTRTHDDFQSFQKRELHTAILALGSNLGDRFYNIEYALRQLENPHQFASETEVGSSPKVAVVDTSFLYETVPMYVTDQPAFINGACMIETNLEPLQLLRLLKAIEPAVGRTPTIRNGPRVVDLDIIFYDDLVLDTRDISKRSSLDNLTGELVVPHPRLQEREFVLRPISDMIPGYIHPVLGRPVSYLLNKVPRNDSDPPMLKVLPFPDLPLLSSPADGEDVKPPKTLSYWIHPSLTSSVLAPSPSPKPKTRVMATLNVTPDSFSDGSDHNTLSTALSYVEDSVGGGADIIDIGGYSTRPSAAFVSVEEEIQRVAPVVQAIHNNSREAIRTVPISVDTFRSEVAEAAISAGGNMINDVYAFTGPKSLPETWQQDGEALHIMDKMKVIGRKYATPVVLMHSRGDAGQNKDYSAYAYAEKLGTAAVIEGVRIELGDKVDRIVKGKGGLRRWLIIADPGIGFSKTVADNLELLRNGSRVIEDTTVGHGETRRRNPLAGLPTLVGTSRKSFIGTILSKAEKGREAPPKERVWATAAGVACAIQQGAMVVRVHDVKEMGDVVIMADALWS
ncbi:hypothetical protein D9756_009402 [Leucocoprinus leucothites]|uniref:Pterin-binding domain-containing protein n=1 Tax=Leucocoprinus leucothites TaxID=201217 RepID=A0A8H5CZ58_9AGAR|nr:hypothetical protein D9756_009402 [Leucoagaricus leucothites]